MKQSRRMSLAEAIANVAVGFVLALMVNSVVLPTFGFHITAAQNIGIAGIMTVVSIARSYTLRRIFEAIRTARSSLS